MIQKLKDGKLLPQSFETKDLNDLDEAGRLSDFLLSRVRETVLGDTQPGFFLG